MTKFQKILMIIGLVMMYIASPVDLIPDFIPILGQLDDLTICGFGAKKVIEVLKVKTA